MTSERFQLFDVTHIGALLVFVVGAVVLVLVGRRRRHIEGPDHVARGLAVALALVALPWQASELISAEGGLRNSLPLQLCNIAWIATVIALWTKNQAMSVMVFLWGVTLSTQALITPDLATPFPHLRFVAFWVLHLLGVWGGIYLVVGLGIRPTWRHYRFTLLVTAAWMVTAFVVNVSAGTNYGYLNRKPPLGSVLDYFPPWPWYVLVEIVLVGTVWALIVAAFRPRHSSRRIA